jgi:hypothetical protein
VAPTKKKKKKNNNSLAHQHMHFTNTLESTLIVLKCMMNVHVFMNLVPLIKKIALIDVKILQNSHDWLFKT